MFVLNVDLWSADGRNEVNLVKHNTQSSPSISAGLHVSYQETAASSYATSMAPTSAGAQSYNPYPGQPQVNPYAASQSSYGGGQPQYQGCGPPSTNGSGSYAPKNGGSYSQQQQPAQAQQMFYTSGAGIHASASGPSPPGMDYQNPHSQSLQAYGGRPPYPQGDINQRVPVSNPPQGMFTRNLIGSLAASAFRLTDPDDKIGIWFVLQDLSVRTEGLFRYVSLPPPLLVHLLLSAYAKCLPFLHPHPDILNRLRFSFVNVGTTTPLLSPANANAPAVPATILNNGKAPVLACCFSDVFQVYSAKKFPGVVESTPLSKCFATQGIKIPIRKDGLAGRRGGDDEDD